MTFIYLTVPHQIFSPSDATVAPLSKTHLLLLTHVHTCIGMRWSMYANRGYSMGWGGVEKSCERVRPRETMYVCDKDRVQGRSLIDHTAHVSASVLATNRSLGSVFRKLFDVLDVILSGMSFENSGLNMRTSVKYQQYYSAKSQQEAFIYNTCDTHLYEPTCNDSI